MSRSTPQRLSRHAVSCDLARAAAGAGCRFILLLTVVDSRPTSLSISLRLRRGFLTLFFRHLYTTLAWTYDFVAWTTSAGQWDAWRSTARRWLPDQGRILELGPGTGHLLLDLRLQGRAVVGLEASQPMARIASGRLHRNALPSIVAQGEAQAQPFPAGSFDAVVATFPSEYILEAATLAEIRRTLRPEGVVVIVAAAWPKGPAVLDRMAAWLFRVTGQTLTPQSAWTRSLSVSDIPLQAETIELPRGIVVVFHGRAPSRP